MLSNSKQNKYKLDYTPNTQIPSGLLAYIVMVVRRNPGMWAFFLFIDVIHGLRYPLAFYCVGQIIDILGGLENNNYVPNDVWFYTGLIFLFLFVGEMVHLIFHYTTFDWIERKRAELRSDMLAYTLNHSFTYFQDNFAGSLARKISEGIEKALNLNAQIRWEILLPIVGMVTSGIVLFSVSWIYGCFVLFFLIAIIGPILVKIRKLREKSQIFADACSQVSGQIVDSLSNISSVKSYAHESREMEEHAHVSEIQMKAWHKMLRVFLLLDNYRRITLVLFGSGMMVACVIGWQHGIITIGNIATIMGISFGFTAAAWHMSFGIIHVSESLGYLNDSLTTLIKPHSVADQDGAKSLKIGKADITFKNVCFKYEGQNIFHDLNIKISSGQRIGLIGHSGAGKSTFVNLIQRFFDVQGGTICIDGQNIAEVMQKSLRNQIAIIPQDTSLFHRSIMDNIRYGRLDASDEEVISAAQRAHATEFIKILPQGFDTMVGERGVKLSGGQRQRIAIARAILKDAPILILDEATSALDSESEQLLQESLEELMKGKTVIAVAHRLSTINRLDRLLVMENGQIIEDGTHNKLISQNGLYNKLWAMQSGGFLPT